MKLPLKYGCYYVENLPLEAKPIPDFPSYFASSDGQIYSTIGRTKKRRYGRNGAGYPICGMRHESGSIKFRLVHRIIAQLFVAGDCSLTVNHIDMDKGNCSTLNLEWISLSDNHQKARAIKKEWARKTGLAVSRAVQATDRETGEVKIFPSGKEAALFVGGPNSAGNISKATRSGLAAYGFTWELV